MHDDKVDAGTLAYMAPESLERKYDEWGRRMFINTTYAIDVWAIGIMYYCMLYGYRPFLGEELELEYNIKN